MKKIKYQVLSIMKKWDVFYFDISDKDITSYASINKIKNLKTTRLLCVNSRTKECIEITKVEKF